MIDLSKDLLKSYKNAIVNEKFFDLYKWNVKKMSIILGYEFCTTYMEPIFNSQHRL
jgi:hypothetical protein